MKKLKSCGVLVMRSHISPTNPQTSFLLLLDSDRYDLPKGHIEPGEDELTCALRELKEETGITTQDIEIDPNFRFVDNYQTQYKRFPNEVIDKTLVVFLGWLKQEVNLKLDTHTNYVWIPWNPPHQIQEKTINPLLEKLQDYLAKSS